MSKVFSRKWSASKNPNKQRKFVFNAPLHIKGKFVNVHLAKELRSKHGVRQLRVKTGDKVKILRGQFKGREVKVNRVDLARSILYLDTIEVQKKAGAKSFYPVHPSNCMIVELVDVKSRFQSKKLESKVAAKKNVVSKGDNVASQKKAVEEKSQ